ncbi:hypothetical protein VTN31DRAFT_4130 [Thermomyces dupontii]|uniref:uncharacterized protein n=1 Tax=Talaromyces thermophilus TaxID=28565 RepID=UPI003742053F
MLLEFEIVPGEPLPDKSPSIDQNRTDNMGSSLFWMDVSNWFNVTQPGSLAPVKTLRLELHFKAQYLVHQDWLTSSSALPVRAELLVKMQRPPGKAQYEPVDENQNEEQFHVCYWRNPLSMRQPFTPLWADDACLSFDLGRVSIQGAKPNHDYILGGRMFFDNSINIVELPLFGVSYGDSLDDIRSLYMSRLELRK